MSGTKRINADYKAHNIELKAEEDRLGITGDFAEGSSFDVILTKGFEKRQYKFRASKEAHAALCVSSFVENEQLGENIHIERYINSQELSGLYNIYIRLNNTTYDTEKSVKF